MSLNQKWIFQGVKNVKNCILTLNYLFSGQLVSLITSGHAFRWSWNLQKLMQVRYTSDLGHFMLWKFSFHDQGAHKISKKTHVERFFQFLMLNTSSIKKLWHKPSEIQWNITGTLRGKPKKKLFGFTLQDITPRNHKSMRNCYFWGYFGGLGTNVEFNGFLWFCEFLKVSASIFWLKTVLTLN